MIKVKLLLVAVIDMGNWALASGIMGGLMAIIVVIQRQLRKWDT
jgi:hypothetical protein